MLTLEKQLPIKVKKKKTEQHKDSGILDDYLSTFSNCNSR